MSEALQSNSQLTAITRSWGGSGRNQYAAPKGEASDSANRTSYIALSGAPGGDWMADAALTAEVVKLGEKIEALGKHMSSIGEHVATLSRAVDGLQKPAKPKGFAALKDAAPVWAPFLAMLIPTIALVLTSPNAQITALNGRVEALAKTLHDDMVAVGDKIDTLSDRTTAVETTLKVKKISP